MRGNFKVSCLCASLAGALLLAGCSAGQGVKYGANVVGVADGMTGMRFCIWETLKILNMTESLWSRKGDSAFESDADGLNRLLRPPCASRHKAVVL